MAENKIYFKGKDIAEFLEYASADKAIREHVSEKYKIKMGVIFNPPRFGGVENYRQ